MRPGLASSVRASFARSLDDATAEALLDLVVAGELDDAARELAKAIGPRDVAEQRRAIQHDLFGAMSAAAVIAEAFVAVGNPAAAAAELLTFVQAFARDFGERARAIARRDELALDAAVREARHPCAWRPRSRRGR